MALNNTFFYFLNLSKILLKVNQGIVKVTLLVFNLNLIEKFNGYYLDFNNKNVKCAFNFGKNDA